MKSERMGKVEKALIFVVLFATLTVISVGCASAATHYVNPGESIQTAINAADPGDTIEVHSGTYNEHVTVNKQLILQGVDTGSGKPVVDAGGSGNAITLSADGITLEGFTATNSDYWDVIYLYSSNNNTITGNTASNNRHGIRLYSSSNNTITGNTVSNNNYCGICLFYHSNDNIIIGNTATNNNDGILLDRSCNNTITANKANNNNYFGICLAYSDNNNITGNTASNNGDYGIHFTDSSNNKVTGNTATNNNYGISVSHFSNDNNITGNIASNNVENGIRLTDSSNNKVTGNTATNNNYGICITFQTNKNKIYLNNFINDQNVFSHQSTNIWNSTEKITYTYNGNTHTSYLGNYWSDYKEKYPKADEIDGCGIYDAPYKMMVYMDYYPLIKPFENYAIEEETKRPEMPTEEKTTPEVPEGYAIEEETKRPEMPTEEKTTPEVPEGYAIEEEIKRPEMPTEEKTTPEVPEGDEKGIPGFEALFAIAVLLAVVYLLRRRI